MNCSAHPSIHPSISYKHRGSCQKLTFLEYPIPEIPDDSEKRSGMDWVLPKIIGSGRVSGTRQSLGTESVHRNVTIFF